MSQEAEARGRREFALALVLGAAGGGLILLALRQVWAHAIFTPPRPLPVQDFPVSGQKLVPMAGALAIAGLACLAAVIATRGVLRRGAGVLLVVIGVGAAVAAAAAVTSGAVLSAALSADPASGNFGGSTTSGTTSGAGSGLTTVFGASAGHASITGLPWRAAAVAGALAIVVAGLATAWRGSRWPVMSARYDRPGQRPEPSQTTRAQADPAVRADPAVQADSATMWESLSRDIDPTVDASSGPGSG